MPTAASHTQDPQHDSHTLTREWFERSSTKAEHGSVTDVQSSQLYNIDPKLQKPTFHVPEDLSNSMTRWLMQAPSEEPWRYHSK